MREKHGAFITRDVLRYLEKDKGSYLRVWHGDNIDEETRAEVIYRGKVYPISLNVSHTARQSKSIYWCGGTIGARDYRWKRKKKFSSCS